MVRALVTSLLAAASLPACVIAPYDWQSMNGTGPFMTLGYTDIPSATVVVEMQGTLNGPWTPVATTTSGSTPIYPAGWFTNNSPALYYYEVNVARPLWQGGTALMRVRNTTSGKTLLGGESGSIDCFFGTVTRTSDFASVAYDCGWSHSPISLTNADNIP